MNALYANSDSLAWITAKLKKNPLVEDVMYQKELVDTVNDNLRRISYVLFGLGRAFGLGFVCAYQQYGPVEHLFRPFRYPYDEIGRSELGIYPSAIYGTEFQPRVLVRFVGRCCAVGRRTYPFAIRPFAFPIYPCRYVARRRGGGAVVRPFAYVGLYVPLRQQVSADESR